MTRFDALRKLGGDGSQAQLAARRGRKCAEAGDWAGAAAAFEHALNSERSHGAWWASLGRAHAELGQWQQALTAYCEALRLHHGRHWWAKGAGRAIKRLAAENGGTLAVHAAPEAFALCGGDDALELYLQDAAPSQSATHLESMYLDAGRSNVHLVRHDFDLGANRHSVIHKVTLDDDEVAKLHYIKTVHDTLPHRLDTPALLSIQEAAGFHHIFLEHRDDAHERTLGWFRATRSTARIEQLGEFFAQVSALPIDDIEDERMRCPDYSPAALDELFARVAASPATTAESVDPAAVAVIHELRAQTELLAEMAARLPVVFCHKDLKGNNIRLVLGESGPHLVAMTIFDWGSAGLDLLGGELHVLVRGRDLTDEHVDRVLRGYHGALPERYRSTDLRELHFAAQLVRLMTTSRHAFTRRDLTNPETIAEIAEAGAVMLELARP